MTNRKPAVTGTVGSVSPSAPLDGKRLDELWDFDDPATSETELRLELDRLEAGSPAHAELRTQIARSMALQHRPADALDELDKVAAAGPDTGRVTTRLALERGRVHNSNGRPDEAVPYFAAAVDAARMADDDFLLVDALHMLAIADRERSDDWTRQALAVTEVTTDERTRRWVGSLRNNFGWSLHDRGDHLGALEQFEQALAAYRRNGSPDQVRIAEWSIARVLRSLGRLDEALAIQRGLLSGPEDAYVHEELAELLLATGQAASARPHFARAAQLLTADRWFDEPLRLARLRQLGSLPEDGSS